MRITDNSRAALREIKREVAETLDDISRDIVSEAKAAVPVETGKLRESIAFEETGELSRRVGTDKEQGLYLETGTRHTAPKPWLTGAMLRAIERFRR